MAECAIGTGSACSRGTAVVIDSQWHRSGYWGTIVEALIGFALSDIDKQIEFTVVSDFIGRVQYQLKAFAWRRAPNLHWPWKIGQLRCQAWVEPGKLYSNRAGGTSAGLTIINIFRRQIYETAFSKLMTKITCDLLAFTITILVILTVARL